jgi:hypothetical protein
LRYPRATPNDKGLVPKINQDDTNFAAIVSVDCPRAIEDRHPICQSQSGSGPNLSLKSLWQLDGHSGRDQRPRSGGQDNLFTRRKSRHEVYPRRILARVRRQLQALTMW